jgi:hypothetical protein
LNARGRIHHIHGIDVAVAIFADSEVRTRVQQALNIHHEAAAVKGNGAG